MITPYMTYKEMYDNLAFDRAKVEIKKEQLKPKAIKALKKARKFPAYEMYEYKIPSTNNSYIICFYAENHFCVEKPECHSFCIVFDRNKRFILTWGATGYKHTMNSEITLIRQINVYTKHFFVRYNERFIKNNALSSNEVACIYLSRNTAAMPIKVNEQINRNHEKYGDCGQQAFRVRDGFCYTRSSVQGVVDEDGNEDKIDAICVIYTTFISQSNMKDNQMIAIDSEHISAMNQFVVDFEKQAKDGIVSLKLEP